MRQVPAVLFIAALAGGRVEAQSPDEGVRPWRSDARFQRIAAALADTRAIDNHTHLIRRQPLLANLDKEVPLLLRSGTPSHATVLKTRFGIAWDPDRAEALDQLGRERREALIIRAGGESAYWSEHLDLARVELALENQEEPITPKNDRLKWVPNSTTLLFPLDSRAVEARNQGVKEDVRVARAAIGRLLSAAGLSAPPATLEAYLAFVEAQLARWKGQGAVALKFYDAYHRTLLFRDVPRSRAAELYTRGLTTPLEREAYLEVQDHLARHIMIEAGRLKLPVQIHSSHGGGPFLRLIESDVRNLEEILADPRFFGTQFVLIHGGAPLIEQAAYLAGNKANVWVDTSALPFLYPTTELAAAYRKYIAFAPDRTLFGTDAGGSPTIPVGAEVHHLALVPLAREALTLALSGLVRDGVFDEAEAIRAGKAVLRENARRLYGF